MSTHWTKFGLGVCALTALAGGASAQKPSNAERGLLGINLYDTGAKIIALYGSPDQIEAVSIGGGNTNGGGNPGFGGPGFGGPGSRPGGGGPSGSPSGRGGSPGPGAVSAGADWIGGFGFGDEMLRQSAMAPPGKGGMGGGGMAAPPGGRSGSGGYPGGPSGSSGGYPGGSRGGSSGYPGGPSGSGGSGSVPTASGATETTKYTRWVYNRLGSKYGFIVDGQGRVVQIEAIGMQNNRVKTRKGLGFGATFAQIIRTYGNPDGYEVGGDTILVKYLVNKKVAFRLSRLQAKKPHVVTGVVVSAGKV